MENEIVESEVLEMEVELEVYDKVKAAVYAAKARCNVIVLKYDTPQDIKDSKSFIYQLRQLKAPIAQAHKEGKAEALKFTRAMDAMKNTLIGAVDDMIEDKYAPIKVIEDAEAARKAEAERIEQERIEAEEAARLAEIEAREKAAAEKEAYIAAQLAELERNERETRIAEEAKKKAEEDAAKRERILESLHALQKQSERATVEKKQRIEREKTEAYEMAETARINNEKHRSDVHRAIYKELIVHMELAGTLDHMGPVLSKLLTQALIDGKIPNVTINY